MIHGHSVTRLSGNFVCSDHGPASESTHVSQYKSPVPPTVVLTMSVWWARSLISLEMGGPQQLWHVLGGTNASG